MWFSIDKPTFLFKTVDLCSYINAYRKMLAYALNPIESPFFSQDFDKNPENLKKFEGIPHVVRRR